MDREAIRAALTRSDLFAGVDDTGLDAALSEASWRQVAQGDTLLRQGDPPRRLYLVGSGLVKMSRLSPGGSELILRFMGPGDLVGCAAVFLRFPYPAMATVVGDGVILAWSATRIAMLMDDHPRIVRNALGIVGSRAHEFVARLGDLANKRAEQRIASTLLRMADQTGRRVEDGVEVAFNAPLRDLAEMTSATYYTVSRAVSAWKKQGIVDGDRRRIVIKAPHRLFEIAEDL